MTKMIAKKWEKRTACCSVIALMAATGIAPAWAQSDEIVVTARKKVETLQDVPVTISVVGSKQLETFTLDKIADIGTRIPTFNVQTGGSGSGGSLALRGIGSSQLSAAFDSAVLIDVDGVPISTMRIVQSAFMDVEQVEVLKGPQALYFGKSATAGVLALNSKGPGDEFEAGFTASYETEEQGQIYEGFISGPLTETFGARLALRYMNNEELFENTAVGGQDFGEESLDGRLTLDWQPTEALNANFKLSYSDYENDGSIQFTDVTCTGGTTTTNALIGFPVITSPNDCDPFNGVVQFGPVFPALAANFEGNGVQDEYFGGVETLLGRLRLDYDLTDTLSITSVTGYFDLESDDFGNYHYDGSGLSPQQADNSTESWTQEVRLQSSFEGRVNFMLGGFYQTRDIVFGAWQAPIGAGIIGPDAITGFTSDYRRVVTTETSAYSLFGEVDIDLTDRLTISAGLRWTDEEKEATFEIPYTHVALSGGFGFDPSGTVVSGLEFEDDNVSPEVSAVYAVNDDINLFAAYKTGFKSGGIDNSALPRGLTDPAIQQGLIFDSETAEGFEGGIKSTLADGRLNLNATAFHYIYEDLQVQNIDLAIIQFITSNAGEVTTKGAEADFVWAASDELDIFGALAYTSSEFTKSFVQTEELNGRAVARSPEWAGNIGFDYTKPIGADLELVGSGLVAFASEYFLDEETLTDVEEDGYVTLDTSIGLGAQDGKWLLQFSIVNLTDELYGTTGSRRPGQQVGENDNVINLNRGRQMFIRAGVRF